MNTTKIIAIPFAGGNIYSFKTIKQHLTLGMEWVTIELPGRGMRFSEPLLHTVEEMVVDLLEQISFHIQESDYIIYGHSMGTLLGYELTKKLIEKEMKLPNCLFFTGRGAPSGISKEKITGLPKVLFWEKVHEMGGLPKDILDCEELLDIYYPILHSDFSAIEDYQYVAMESPFPIPIQICMGTDEIGEGKNKITIENVHAWNKETIFPCKLEVLDGDHFFIFKQPKVIAQQIEYTISMIKMYCD